MIQRDQNCIKAIAPKGQFITDMWMLKVNWQPLTFPLYSAEHCTNIVRKIIEGGKVNFSVWNYRYLYPCCSRVMELWFTFLWEFQTTISSPFSSTLAAAQQYFVKCTQKRMSIRDRRLIRLKFNVQFSKMQKRKRFSCCCYCCSSPATYFSRFSLFMDTVAPFDFIDFSPFSITVVAFPFRRLLLDWIL